MRLSQINLFKEILEFPTFYKNHRELLCVAFLLVLKVHSQVWNNFWQLKAL